MDLNVKHLIPPASPESKVPGSGSCFYRIAQNKEVHKAVF